MVSFMMIMLFYLLLSIGLAWAGNYFLGYGYMHGFVLGMLISIVLWVTVGKNMVS